MQSVLHAPFRKRLFASALRITGNAADADDVIQSAFLRALESRVTFRTEGERESWLRTVVYRLAIDTRRRDRVRRTCDMLDASELPTHEQPAPRWSNVSMDDLRSITARCHPNLRKTFELHERGLPYREISRRLHIPMATVATRLHRIRNAIREEFLRTCANDSDREEFFEEELQALRVL